EISLAELRESAGAVVTEELVRLSQLPRPAVCAPDVETLDDLELIAAAFRQATRRGARVVVRCGPAFAGVVSGAIARAYVPSPPAPEGVLVISGSYVP